MYCMLVPNREGEKRKDGGEEGEGEGEGKKEKEKEKIGREEGTGR